MNYYDTTADIIPNDHVESAWSFNQRFYLSFSLKDFIK